VFHVYLEFHQLLHVHQHVYLKDIIQHLSLQPVVLLQFQPQSTHVQLVELVFQYVPKIHLLLHLHLSLQPVLLDIILDLYQDHKLLLHVLHVVHKVLDKYLDLYLHQLHQQLLMQFLQTKQHVPLQQFH